MIEKKPFTMYRSEEAIKKSKDKSTTLTIRLNPEEQARLKDLKVMFSLHTDGTAIKLGMEAGYNVLHTLLGTQLLKRLTSERRVREEQE